MNETWKGVDDYPYMVSNEGHIKSLKTGKILKPATLKNGYQMVILCDENHCKKAMYVHRLVAQAFLPNPDGLPQINHKDKIRNNNFVDNLEWCDAKYNANYLREPRPVKPTKSRKPKIPQTDLEIIEEIISKLYPSKSA